MSKFRGAVVVNEARCKGCNLCVVSCPTQSISLAVGEVNHRGYAFCKQTNWEACIGCAMCSMVCPDGCITVYKIKTTD